MAFLHPKYFPALCATKTKSDPKDIRYNGYQVYPVGMSLEQAMALVWKPKKFQIEASFKIGLDQCKPNQPCQNLTATLSGTSNDDSAHANLAKMSDLICLDSYYPEYTLDGFTDGYSPCPPDPPAPPYPPVQYETNTDLFIIINSFPVIPASFPIYLYDGLYYLCMFYGVGSGVSVNLLEGFYTESAGDFTIELTGLPAIKLPLYAVESDICDPTTASATYTMTTEREKN